MALAGALYWTHEDEGDGKHTSVAKMIHYVQTTKFYGHNTLFCSHACNHVH